MRRGSSKQLNTTNPLKRMRQICLYWLRKKYVCACVCVHVCKKKCEAEGVNWAEIYINVFPKRYKNLLTIIATREQVGERRLFFILYLFVLLEFLTIANITPWFLKKKVSRDHLVELWDIFIYFLYFQIFKKTSYYPLFFLNKSVILKNNLSFLLGHTQLFYLTWKT